MRKALRISKYMPSASQARLELFVSEKRVSLALEHPYERLIRQALFVAIIMLMLAYVYFVSASILNIMARKEASTAALAMQSSIASMESAYFALSHAVSPASAESAGLAKVVSTNYVYRPGNAASAAVTMDRNEI